MQYFIDKTGCQWRYLPKNYPPHGTVWSFYRRARESGMWETIMDELVKQARLKARRKANPSYGIIDSQSTKTVSGSEEVGIDGGKKVKGRKRHIITDIMGNMLTVKVHAENIHDTMSGCHVYQSAKNGSA